MSLKAEREGDIEECDLVETDLVEPDCPDSCPVNGRVKVESQRPTGGAEKASSYEINHAVTEASKDVVSAVRQWFKNIEETDGSGCKRRGHNRQTQRGIAS
ncbi:hypothetical protein MTO96_023706 [Rhipicephalus appendiculatus]